MRAGVPKFRVHSCRLQMNVGARAPVTKVPTFGVKGSHNSIAVKIGLDSISICVPYIQDRSPKQA